MSILIQDPGFFTTIQDLGRPGYRKWGVPESGAADHGSFRLANEILDNKNNSPALECTFKGGSFIFEKDATIAITGADMNPAVNGIQVGMEKKIHLRKGDKLTLSTAVKRYRTYIAVEEGFRVKEVMGSASTCIPAGFGGYEGRCLKAGDRLEWHIKESRSRDWSGPSSTDTVQNGHRDDAGDRTEILIHPGPEWFLLNAQQKESFVHQPYEIKGRSDRMAIHLTGTSALKIEKSMVSSPVIPGMIQLPSKGDPIILFRDAQTMGGYPRIAMVQQDQLDILAQLRPGERIHFKLTDSLDPESPS